MQEINWKLIVTFPLPLLIQFVLLPTSEIVAYQGRLPMLILLHILMFVYFYWCYRYTPHLFFEKTFGTATAIITSSAIISAVLAFFLFTISGTTEYHIVVGDYLRDNWGINIYFMDFGGWVLTTATLWFSAAFGVLTRVSGKKIEAKKIESI